MSRFSSPGAPETCILLIYLNPSLRQLNPQGEFLPEENVRIMGFLESPFQLLELKVGEGGAVASLFPLADVAGWHPLLGEIRREVVG